MEFIINISKEELTLYTINKLESSFPDKYRVTNAIKNSIDKTLERVEYCFSKVNNKYYNRNGSTFFDYLNTDQYAAFLYYLSNTIWENEDDVITAKKVYSLNKALHGIDVFYEINLPDIFFFSHSVGTVLGRAKYSDYLIISQGVTIGGNRKLVYPEIGRGVYLFSGSAVVGNSKIGNNNLISIGTIIREEITPDNVVVYNDLCKTAYKPTNVVVQEDYFIG